MDSCINATNPHFCKKKNRSASIRPQAILTEIKINIRSETKCIIEHRTSNESVHMENLGNNTAGNFPIPTSLNNPWWIFVQLKIHIYPHFLVRNHRQCEKE